VDGRVIFYADIMTESMQRTIDETSRRSEKQVVYNTEHGIVPTTIIKSIEQVYAQGSVLDIKGYDPIQTLCAAGRPGIVQRMRRKNRKPTRPFRKWKGPSARPKKKWKKPPAILILLKRRG
jgi:excinuclease ABC subunit B